MAVSLYLIRHAQSTANVDPRHLIGGRNLQVPLTDEGYRQAKLLGKCLRQKGVECDVAYCSPALRTAETARIVLKEMEYEGEVVFDLDLLERDQGDWSGRPRTSVYYPPSRDFRPGDRQKGESEHDVAQRMSRALERIVRNARVNTNVFIFSHAHAIRCLLAEWCEIPVQEIYIDNTSVTHLRVTSREVICSHNEWGNTDHLH